jgi:hypothetical protein
MLSVGILSVIMLSGILLRIIILIVVAPTQVLDSSSRVFRALDL